MQRSLLLSAALLCLVGCDKTREGADAQPKASVVDSAAATLGVPPLDASGLPRFRPGLWQVVREDDSDDSGPETVKSCIGEEANAELRAALAGSPGCQTTRSTGVGGLTVTSVCAQGETKVKSVLTLAGNDTAYNMSIAMQLTLPDGKTSGGRVTGKARWVGPCPAGMKPGDEIGGDEN